MFFVKERRILVPRSFLIIFAIVVMLSLPLSSLVLDAAPSDNDWGISIDYDEKTQTAFMNGTLWYGSIGGNKPPWYDDMIELYEKYADKVVTVVYTSEGAMVDVSYATKYYSQLSVIDLPVNFKDMCQFGSHLYDMDGNEYVAGEAREGTYVLFTDPHDPRYKQFSYYNAVCGSGVLFKYNEDTLNLSWALTGNGKMFDYDDPAKLPWTSDFTTLNINIGVVDIGKNAFSGKTNLNSLRIASMGGSTTLKEIGDRAFAGCTGLKEVDLGTSLVTIGERAFEGCTSLTKIDLPKSFRALNGFALEGCSGLESIIVDEGNTTYSSVDGVLFNKDEKNIIKYPQGHGHSYTIAEGVRKISGYAFSGCDTLTYLRFPYSLSEVEEFAFDSLTFYDRDGSTILEKTADNLAGFVFRGFGDGKLYKTGWSPLTVTFDPCSGTCPIERMTTNENGMLDSYPSAHLEGHDFLGWFPHPGGSGDPIPSDQVYTIDTTIYAGYSDIKSHHVTYDAAGGSGFPPKQSDVLEGMTFKVSPFSGTKAGNVFGGWSYDSHTYREGDVITMGSEDIVLTAVWIPKASHHVVYDVAGGSGTPPVQDDVTEELTFIIGHYNGKKDGFTFGDWFCNGSIYRQGDEVVMGTEDMEFVAIWNPKPYHHITYDLDGGSGSVPFQEDVREDSSFTVRGYGGTKAGCHFLGWLYDFNVYQPGDSVRMGKDDIVLTAFWSAGEAHHVTYDINGGDADAPVQSDVIEGSTFLLSYYSGSKKGYEFRGWSHGGHDYMPGDIMIMLNEDMTFTAVWKKIDVHHVIYDTRGGSTSAPTQKDLSEGSTFIVKDYDGTRERYEFDGWSYDNRIYQPGDVVTMGDSDISFRAEWKSTEPDPGPWKNPMLTFLFIVVSIAAVLLVCTHLYFRRN